MNFGDEWGLLWSGPAEPLMQVIYNQGEQIVSKVPISEDGRVTRVTTAATYSILDLRNTDDDGAPLVIAGPEPATLDGASATLTAPAGPSETYPNRIPVTSIVGFVEGRTYIISEDGHREAFTLRAIGDDVLHASADLTRDYTDEAVVEGVQLQGLFPEGVADNQVELANGAGPFLAVWTYEIAGRMYVERDTIWLTRYSLAPLCSEADVIAAWPEATRRVRGQGVSIAGAIRMAMEDYVAEIESAGKDPRYFVTASAGKNAVRERALQYLREWMGTDTEDVRAERHETRYQNLMRSLLNGRPDHGTIEIKPSTNTAPPGTSKISGSKFFVRT